MELPLCAGSGPVRSFLHLLAAVDELAARDGCEDIREDGHQETPPRPAPKTTPGAERRSAERPAVCSTTSSLSPIMRVKM